MSIIPACSPIAHMIFWVCVAIAMSVYAVMLYSLVAIHRHQNAASRIERPVATEILWASIPIFIMVSAAVPVVEPWLLADQACTTTVAASAPNSDVDSRR